MDFPTAISGGCLCGAIRYSISASDQTPWPPTSSSCQCTMCRKWTSSLTAQFLVVATANLKPQLCEYETYEEYESSPRRFRGFCRRCGSSLIWRSDDDARTLDVFLGTLDEQWLAHDSNNKVSEALARPNGTQFWMENAIVGVTDLLEGGKKYPREGPDGRFEGVKSGP